MKRMPAGGYTIIETLIFLAVSSALMASAMAVINGKQERTRYTQSVATFEQELKDSLNDVSTGYYPSNQDFKCEKGVSGGPLPNNIRVGPGSNEQGANPACIFLGKAIKLNNGSDYSVYTMAASRDAESLDDSTIRLLGWPPNAGTPEKKQIDGGVQVTKVVQRGTATEIAGIAAITGFNDTPSSGSTASGSAAKVKLYGITKFNDNPVLPKLPNRNMFELPQGALICLRQDGNGRASSVTIGKGGQQLATESQVDSSECST